MHRIQFSSNKTTKNNKKIIEILLIFKRRNRRIKVVRVAKGVDGGHRPLLTLSQMTKFRLFQTEKV